MYNSDHKLIKIFNGIKDVSEDCERPHSTIYGYFKSSKLYNNNFYKKSGNWLINNFVT